MEEEREEPKEEPESRKISGETLPVEERQETEESGRTNWLWNVASKQFEYYETLYECNEILYHSRDSFSYNSHYIYV